MTKTLLIITTAFVAASSSGSALAQVPGGGGSSAGIRTQQPTAGETHPVVIRVSASGTDDHRSATISDLMVDGTFSREAVLPELLNVADELVECVTDRTQRLQATIRVDDGAVSSVELVDDRERTCAGNALRRGHALPLTTRDRVGPARTAVLSALFDRTPPAPVTAAVITLLHAVDGLGALLSLNDRGWRWVHGRAAAIAGGSWVDESPTTVAEVNLAVTAAAVRQALARLP